MQTEDLKLTVTLQQCQRAYYNASHDPNRRGATLHASMLHQFTSILDACRAADPNDPGFHTWFANGYNRRAAEYVAAISRTVNWAVVGPANLNLQRVERANLAERLRYQKLDEFCKHAKSVVRRKEGKDDPSRPITLGDHDAVERLEERIATLKQLHEQAKNANKAIRKHTGDAAAQVEALKALGISPADIDKLMSGTSKGYPGYHLQNSNKTIAYYHTQLQRAQQLREMARAADDAAVAKGEEPTGIAVTTHPNGVRVEVDAAANRTRIYFPSKAFGSAMHKVMRSAGFRWAPSQGAYSGYCNPGSERMAKACADFVNPETVKEAT